MKDWVLLGAAAVAGYGGLHEYFYAGQHARHGGAYYVAAVGVASGVGLAALWLLRIDDRRDRRALWDALNRRMKDDVE